jgi:DnaJ-class molecular chaperone
MSNKEKATTIRCEACQGRGFVEVSNMLLSDPPQPITKTTCPLCNGTGREPADTAARKHVERQDETP